MSALKIVYNIKAMRSHDLCVWPMDVMSDHLRDLASKAFPIRNIGQIVSSNFVS